MPFDHRRRGLVVFPREVALRCEIPVGGQRAEALVHVVVVHDLSQVKQVKKRMW